MTGLPLQNSLVESARQEEMRELEKHRVYEVVSVKECQRVTGKNPIGVKWVDINKGDEKNPEYRSRLVAQEINTDKREDLFAATPPLDAFKIILSIAVMKDKALDFIDVRRACFHAEARRDIFVNLPKEDPQHGSGKCGRLIRAMYGTRDAAQNWEYAYVDFMESAGFVRGIVNPCGFENEEKYL